MTALRIVLDTNVLVSGLLGGSALTVLRRWRRGELTLVVSPSIFAEYGAVLARPKFGLPHRLVSELLSFVRMQAEWVEPDIDLDLARDPDDDKFLEAAVCARADYVVSADKDLLDLEVIEGVPIVPPWKLPSSGDLQEGRVS